MYFFIFMINIYIKNNDNYGFQFKLDAKVKLFQNCLCIITTIYDPTCAPNDSTFSREKHILYAWMF